MGSGILDLTNRGNKIAERLSQDVQEALTKHELEEVILPAEVEKMLDEFIASHNKGLKRVRPINFPGIEDNIDQELEDVLFVTHGLLEGFNNVIGLLYFIDDKFGNAGLFLKELTIAKNGYVVLAISKILDPIFACNEDETPAMHAW
ncbi:7039_t:CDS:2 [Paraglomus brasilianum]|uniref:7039_t:CDS:1 n=1 Tax=Paraglomus brasilianum TaxID=144538 RepID=A0A9N9B7Y6_9GLOM|nr:7039_t:CDS:2 [Paraglomus brasilianum]